MLSPAKIEEFGEKGFVLGGRVLGDEEVDLLRAELERVIEEQGSAVPQPVHIVNLSGKPEAPVWQIVNIWEASEPYRRLTTNPVIVEEIAQLTGASQLRVWHDQIQYKPAETGGVNAWHQDSPYWPILTPKTSQVSAWVALDDVDESNGCMRMVSGSYHWGNNIDFIHTVRDIDSMPATFEDHDLKVELCPVAKGHVHYHHSLTWHGSHANTSGNPRRAIAVHYMTEETGYDAGGKHAMKRFVSVSDGERLEGEHFPLVFDNGAPVGV